MRRRDGETLGEIAKIVFSKVSGARQDLRSAPPHREQLHLRMQKIIPSQTVASGQSENVSLCNPPPEERLYRRASNYSFPFH
jgi:hypothetical protein